ncbi:MAG: ribosome small subunit-dependent GTPase A [Thermoanaerobaculia bacterium]
MSLIDYGWNDSWAERLSEADVEGGIAARVVAEHRELFRVHTGSEEIAARIAGRLRHVALSSAELPAVGDWVVIDSADERGDALIQNILPRRSVFSRKAAGKRTDEQIVAANVDTVWIVSPADADRNPARIERYLTMVWESGASPVVVLSKADLSPAPERTIAEVAERVIGAPSHAVSAISGAGLDELEQYLAPGSTIALLGPSGAGKSTLINRLAGQEVMRTAEVRDSDSKGRHTTTHRQLVLLPSGALLLDTPGLRELQLWSAEEGLEKSFADIEALAAGCRFSDCGHDSEPGCAVQAAIRAGTLDLARFESFRKLEKELAYLERKQDVRADLAERQRWKEITKDYRRWFKKRG